MKTNAVLSGAAAAVALCAMNAPAQFNYQNGDLLAAFGNGGTKDVILDLGAISKFQAAPGTTYSWNLNYLLTSVLGGVNSSLYWSAFGVNDTTIGGNPTVTQSDPNTIWNTLARINLAVKPAAPFDNGNSAAQQLPLGDIVSIANLTNPSKAGAGQITDYAPGIELVNTSLGGYSTMMSSPYNGNLQGDWYYNILNTGAGVSDLFQSPPNARASDLGSFTLNSSGLLSFTATPEPSTWAMLGSGLLALFATRRFRK